MIYFIITNCILHKTKQESEEIAVLLQLSLISSFFACNKQGHAKKNKK